MKCPHCQEEIPGSPCPECGVTSPEGARYCMACGASLHTGEDSTPEDYDELDFDNRVLCPDGTCTGIIVNGRCTVCEQVVTDEESTEERKSNS